MMMPASPQRAALRIGMEPSSPAMAGRGARLLSRRLGMVNHSGEDDGRWSGIAVVASAGHASATAGTSGPSPKRSVRPPAGPATVGDIAASIHLVAQSGEEPLVAALRAGAEAMVAGRRRDPAVVAVAPIPRSCPRGQALHMGEVLGLAALTSLP